jgi:hypothetical protein
MTKSLWAILLVGYLFPVNKSASGLQSREVHHLSPLAASGKICQIYVAVPFEKIFEFDIPNLVVY